MMPKLLIISLVIGVGALLIRPYRTLAQTNAQPDALPDTPPPTAVEPVYVHARTANGKPLRVFTNPLRPAAQAG